jgi:hypothetical protein
MRSADEGIIGWGKPLKAAGGAGAAGREGVHRAWRGCCGLVGRHTLHASADEYDYISTYSYNIVKYLLRKCVGFSEEW